MTFYLHRPDLVARSTSKGLRRSLAQDFGLTARQSDTEAMDLLNITT